MTNHEWISHAKGRPTVRVDMAAAPPATATLLGLNSTCNNAAPTLRVEFANGRRANVRQGRVAIVAST